MIPIKHLLLLFLIGFTLNADCQQWPSKLSKDAQIALLTVSPGSELYSLFGHSALRVVDPKQNFDMVFNYGAFHFEPTFEFYWRFIRGRLNYQLSVYPYEMFLKEYRYYNRSVVQQFLELTDTQKGNIYNFLLRNNLPENRAYRYDFFFDNCSTRIRDIFEQELKSNIDFYPNDRKFGKTYRVLVNEYTSAKPWVDLGINLILGYPADKKVTGHHYMFLPDYLMSAFDSAFVTVGGKYSSFVKQKEVVLERQTDDSSVNHSWYTQPTILSWLIFLPFFIISIVNFLRGSRTKWIDVLLYPIAGFLGLFFLFCWFGTDHIVLSWNLNLFWAFPSHIIMALLLVIIVGKPWVRWYFLVSSLFAMLTLVNWYWLPQPLHSALVPLIALLAFRGVVICRGSNVLNA